MQVIGLVRLMGHICIVELFFFIYRKKGNGGVSQIAVMY